MTDWIEVPAAGVQRIVCAEEQKVNDPPVSVVTQS